LLNVQAFGRLPPVGGQIPRPLREEWATERRPKATLCSRRFARATLDNGVILESERLRGEMLT